jgi:hypothetical protein
MLDINSYFFVKLFVLDSQLVLFGNKERLHGVKNKVLLKVGLAVILGGTLHRAAAAVFDDPLLVFE